MSVNPKWTAHIKDAELKEKFRVQVLEAKGVMDRLSDLLKKDKTALEQQIKSFDFLVLPGTKERLVARLAEIRRLEQIINLLEV
jgi:hypothetical protein